jgi:hypothetical protein
MRLYQNFHDPYNSLNKRQQDESLQPNLQEAVQSSKVSSFFNNSLQVYIAGVVTTLLFLNLSKRKP